MERHVQFPLRRAAAESRTRIDRRVTSANYARTSTDLAKDSTDVSSALPMGTTSVNSGTCANAAFVNSGARSSAAFGSGHSTATESRRCFSKATN
jgi:hypothetical protein